MRSKRFYYLVGRTHYPMWIAFHTAALARSIVIFLKYGVIFLISLRAANLALVVYM